MKKTALLLMGLILFYSCLNNDNNDINYTYEYIPIDEAITPDSFIFGEKDTISIKYSLPNSCYSFERLYYKHQDTTRTVAVIAFLDLNGPCIEGVIQEEYKFVVEALQTEDYVFKFFKGIDSNGESIFDEVVVPVN